MVRQKFWTSWTIGRDRRGRFRVSNHPGRKRANLAECVLTSIWHFIGTKRGDLASAKVCLRAVISARWCCIGCCRTSEHACPHGPGHLRPQLYTHAFRNLPNLCGIQTIFLTNKIRGCHSDCRWAGQVVQQEFQIWRPARLQEGNSSRDSVSWKASKQKIGAGKWSIS